MSSMKFPVGVSNCFTSAFPHDIAAAVNLAICPGDKMKAIHPGEHLEEELKEMGMRQPSSRASSEYRQTA